MNEDLIAVLERIARALENIDKKFDEMTRTEVEHLKAEWGEACGLLTSEALAVERLTGAIYAAIAMIEAGQNLEALRRLRMECGVIPRIT